jgi:hypothetical protein
VNFVAPLPLIELVPNETLGTSSTRVGKEMLHLQKAVFSTKIIVLGFIVIR